MIQVTYIKRTQSVIVRIEMMGGRVWMRIVVFSLLFHLGASDLVATANFSTIAIIVPLQWGQRSSSQSCQLNFPSVTTPAGLTYVFMRFNVKVLNFTHTMAFNPDSVTFGSSSRWLLARADYTYLWSLTFAFSFTFDDYLGTDKPTGDCTMFTDYVEALAFATATPDINYVLPSRLVTTTPFDSAYKAGTTPGWDDMVTTCSPSFVGILGLNEIYIYVYFDMQVHNLTSAYGTEFVSVDPAGWWYFGRYPSQATSFFSDSYAFSVPTSANPDYQNGNCSVYAVSNDTLPGLINVLSGASTTSATTTELGTTAATTTELGTTAATTTELGTTAATTTELGTTAATTTELGTTAATTTELGTTAATTTELGTTAATTTELGTTAATTTELGTTAAATTELGTTVNSPTVVTTSDSTSTTTHTLNSTIPTPTNASITFKIIGTFTHSGQRRMMREDVTMRNQFVTGRPENWTIGDLNPMTCGRRCLTDPECMSVFFSTQTKTCHGHSVVYSKGDDDLDKTSYYVIV